MGPSEQGTNAPISVVTAPRGFWSHVANVGIKDGTRDLSIVVSEVPCTAVGVFTQSHFAGPAVTRSRAALASGTASVVVTVSKNANVANGPEGAAHAQRLEATVAEALGVEPSEVVQGCTGVIGRRLPVERVERYLAGLAPGLGGVPSAFEPLDVASVAEAIMTTDTVPKYVGTTLTVPSTEGGVPTPVQLVGVAKGVGMIEPDMATLLTYFFTDAEIPAADLEAMFRRVVDRTFNCLSIDTDTSTSDSAVILANGLAGPVDLAEFEAALLGLATELVLAIAADGEGATKVIEVTVNGATDDDEAKLIAKLVVNSPLVKTAVHGADPNWGRVVMAVGKAKGTAPIDPDRTVVRFGGHEVYPTRLDGAGLAQVEALLAEDAVAIEVDLGLGTGSAMVWGCDLSDGYVRINADYTT